MTRPPLPEWAPHEAVWIGFPSHAELWEDDLAPAQAEVAAFAKAVHAGGKGEAVWLVAANEEAAAEARALVPFARVSVEPFGDIWLRDTAAIVLGSGEGRRGVDFLFNGWGGKYRLEGDDIPRLARLLSVVDVFDALTTERPYKPALPADRAVAELHEEAARGWKCEELVTEFAALVDGAAFRGIVIPETISPLRPPT